ncbi:hypothetical protein ABLE91_05905 [Aquabacter sp. CN5-332]|uniref:hypothetical protein n=1 Tax=Aquabacter sp. CN5-332 TaxID=3156608 RepID=UPI0032B4AC72
MPSEPLRAEPIPFDVSEDEVDAALAVCDGDARATIRALLVEHAFLEHQLSKLASAGFSRRLPLAKLSDVQG